MLLVLPLNVCFDFLFLCPPVQVPSLSDKVFAVVPEVLLKAFAIAFGAIFVTMLLVACFMSREADKSVIFVCCLAPLDLATDASTAYFLYATAFGDPLDFELCGGLQQSTLQVLFVVSTAFVGVPLLVNLFNNWRLVRSLKRSNDEFAQWCSRHWCTLAVFFALATTSANVLTTIGRVLCHLPLCRFSRASFRPLHRQRHI